MGNPRPGSHTDQKPSASDKDVLSSEAAITPGDSLALMAFLSPEIIARMGKDFLNTVPLELMEKFCVASVERNDPTGELLQKIVQNFMIAYSNPDTRDEALKAYDFLDYLSEPH